MNGGLLVSAGEASGDEAAADVVSRLGVRAFGLSGEALRKAGVETVADARTLSVMGAVGPLSRANRIARAAIELLRAAKQRRPAAALLVGFSEFNARLGRALRARGTFVLWYAPPQVWAWRPQRAARLRESCDRMAVVLPFEEAVWRQAGALAEFVGHPAVERAVRAGAPKRGAGRPAQEARLGLFPGSRNAEVARHAPVLFAAAERLADRLPAEVVLAPSLEGPLLRRITRHAEQRGIRVSLGPAANRLRALRVAVAASGTVTADCAVAGVPAAIVYRTDPLTFALARRLVRVDDIGLPNLVLGHRVFPELVQGAVSEAHLVRAVEALLDDHERYAGHCERVRALLTAPCGRAPSERVADLLAPFLDRSP